MFTPLVAALPYDANWFDIVWVVALVFGIWSGIRCGALGEAIRLISWVLMIWVSVKYYEPVGVWVRPKLGLEEEPSQLVAFVGIILAIYLVSLLIRKLVYRWTRKSASPAMLETFGGAVLGMSRMAIVMAFVTIGLSLVRSPFWHRHISRESKFGSTVVKMIPSVEAVTKKVFPETFPLFRDIERPIDADADEIETNKTTKTKKAR